MVIFYIIIGILIAITLLLVAYLIYTIRQQKIKKRRQYSYFVPRRPNFLDRIKRYWRRVNLQHLLGYLIAIATLVYYTQNYTQGNQSYQITEIYNSTVFTKVEKPITIADKNLWLSNRNKPHPLVMNIPANEEVSIKSVANYIADHESDPFQRIKALHDYVATRISYDADAYFSGEYPPQDPQTVFKTRQAVCQGYANLLMALSKAINEEILIIVGDSRTQISNFYGQGHAWNAAKIQGYWYLIDPTWDSGYVNESGFYPSYNTNYLFTPPEVMIMSHFPNNKDWQLLSNPLPKEEFLNNPMIQPEFFAKGLSLISPKQFKNNVNSVATIEINNPNNNYLLAKFNLIGSNNNTEDNNCQINQGIITSIKCKLPKQGEYIVDFFAAQEKYGNYNYLGRFQFNY